MSDLHGTNLMAYMYSMSVPNKGELSRVITDEWFTECIGGEVDSELGNRNEITGHMSE